METKESIVRLSIDIPAELRFRLKHAALRERVTMREYVLETLQERLTKAKTDEERRKT